MNTKFIHILLSLLTAVLMVTSCQNERSIELYEEGEATIDVSFSVRDFEVAELRSHLRPEDEHAIDGLAIWVFDSKGNLYNSKFIADVAEYSFEANELPVEGNAPDGKPGVGNPYKGTKKKGDLTSVLPLKLKSKSDALTIYAIANFNSSNFSLESADGSIDYNTIQQFEKIKTLDELKALRLNTNHLHYNTTGTERFESPLMYATHKVTIDDITAGKVSIQLIPYEVKFTFRVKGGSDVSINKLSMHVENIPTRSDIFGSLDPSRRAKMTKSELKMLNSDEAYFARLQSGVFERTGYLSPNFAEPKQLITREAIAAAKPSVINGSGYTGFDLRQKQHKNASAAGKVENGEYQYAPDDASILVINAEMEETISTSEKRVAQATYRIVLGDLSGVINWNNPSDEELKKINNYSLKPATHYIYTVTINGVENIKVEAETTDDKVEPNPGAEGVIFDAPSYYQLDSHYEQRTLMVTIDDFVADPKNYSFSYYLVTPFTEGPQLIEYEEDELIEYLKKYIDGERTIDNEWIKVYIEKAPRHGRFPPLGDNSGILYSGLKELDPKTIDLDDRWSVDLTNQLIPIEFLFFQLSFNPDAVQDSYGDMKIHFFFDEYFYDKHPTKPGAQIDKDLWKTFANAPDRMFAIVKEQSGNSPDSKSRYIESTKISFSQHSIKTFFTEAPEGIRIWGVESIDESPNITYYPYDYSGSIRRSMNESHSNGWINTWNLLAGYRSPLHKASGISGHAAHCKNGEMPYEMILKKAGSIDTYPLMHKATDLWKEFTKATTNGVRLHFNKDSGRDRYVDLATALAYDYQNAVFTPYERNRDLNRDGKMQASELRWYIPSQLEAQALVMYEGAFPYYAKLDAPKVGVYQNDLVVYTSTMYENITLKYSGNPIVVVPSLVSALPLQDVVNGFKTDRKTLRSTTRLVRDLGVIEYNPNDRVDGYSYNFDDRYFTKEANKLYKFVPNQPDIQSAKDTKDFGGAFVGYDHMTRQVTRQERIQNELPLHTEKDSAMRMYYKGLKLSKGYALEDPTDSRSKLENLNFADYQTRMIFGKSPCRYYFEKPDMSDRGLWRLPNIAELSFVALSLPHGEDYLYHMNQAGAGQYILWTRTVTAPNAVRSGDEPLAVRIDYESTNELIWPMSAAAPKFGRVLNTWTGYFRCVRDLTDEEWQMYKSKSN